MTYHGHVRNGVVVCDGPAPLPEGAQVRIEVLTEAVSNSQESATLNERLREFVGTAHSLPSDASLNVDQYLYGAPKRS